MCLSSYMEVSSRKTLEQCDIDGRNGATRKDEHSVSMLCSKLGTSKIFTFAYFDRNLCKKPFAMSSILSSCIFDLTEISKLDMHTSYSKTLQYHIWDKTNNADFPSLTKAGNDIDAKLQTATSWTISRYESSSIPDLKRKFERTRFDNSNMPDFRRTSPQCFNQYCTSWQARSSDSNSRFSWIAAPFQVSKFISRRQPRWFV